MAVSPRVMHKKPFDQPKDLDTVFELMGIPNEERSGLMYNFAASPESSWSRQIVNLHAPHRSNPAPRANFGSCAFFSAERDYLVRFLLGELTTQNKVWDTNTFRILLGSCGHVLEVRHRPDKYNTVNEYQQGKEYFQRHKAELERDYPGEYIAIWKDAVIAHGQTFGEVAESAYEQVGYRDIYMPKVGRERRVIRGPAPRLVKRTE